MNIALLTYRGNPHSGGQGVYVHYLSKALRDLGHRVEVLAGPPYPDLAEGIALNRLESLDLYRHNDPFRRPRREEFRDWIDMLEYGAMCTAAFPEPLAFSLRVARALGPRIEDFDIVHDNQCLGYGLLKLWRDVPVVATIHHPCSLDARMELAHATTWKRRASLRRWYAFTRMQGRVARLLPRLISVSETAKQDAIKEFGVRPERVAVVHNGVDTDLFRPLPGVRRVPGRVITTASADIPLKGLVYLIEALAKVRTEQAADLVVIGRAKPNGSVATAIERFGLEDSVRFVHGVDRLRLVELYAKAEVAVVPSLYEGFSLPAIEAMSSGVPVVATRAGAIPEVVGEAARLVPARDAGALASAISRLLGDPGERERLGLAGRERALRHFTWEATASSTVAQYERAQHANR